MKAGNIKNILKQLAGKRGIEFVRVIRHICRVRYLRTGYCNVCGKQTIFLGTNAFTLTQKRERNDLACSRCWASARNRALTAVVLELYGYAAKSLRDLTMRTEFQELNIYSASSAGSVHNFLSDLPNYVSSEYLPGIPSGTIHNGIHCEDLQALSFPDESFSLMISEDVMEHVRHPDSALQEAYRVLKKGCYYVFTIPIYGDKTVARVDTSTSTDVRLLPALYHGDPLRQEGALAYNDFGRDIVGLCTKQGFETRLVELEAKSKNWPCGDVIVAKKPNHG